MAKTLIATFILWIAVVTIALAKDSTIKAPTTNAPTAKTPTTAPTTKTPTTAPTTKAPTTAPTTKTPTTAPTTKTPTTAPTTKTPTTAPTTKTPSTAPFSTKAVSTTLKAPTSTKPSTSASSTPTPPTASHTGTPPTESSSVSPNTVPLPSATQAPATTMPSNICDLNLCPEGSTCQPREMGHVCLCRTGEMFGATGCESAKVFPGQLVLQNIKYKEEMSDKTSGIYQKTATEIEKVISEGLKNTNGYRYSVVLELRKYTVSKVRAEAGNVKASLQNIYEPTADIKESEVKDEIVRAVCKGCLLEGTFDGINLCDADPQPCDKTTMICEYKEGTYNCSCKTNFIPTSLSNRLCLACTNGKYNGSQCVECGFGLGGLNCADNSLLIAVIVSSVLGGLMIIALIALSVVASKSKKKGSKINEEDIGKPYQSHSFAKPPPSYSNGYSASIKEPTNSSTNYEAPRIPRAISNWESRTNLEMTPSNSRQNLISSGRNSRFNENQDDMFSFSQGRPKNNLYEQIPPNSNPYAQNRATNPYTQNRGQTNPYYS